VITDFHESDERMELKPFYWIDAFTKNKFGGNPCAVILGADSLRSDQMQSIAKEMNLSETVFLISTQDGGFGARYFTPQEELPFAGHPTIAAAHALLQHGLLVAKNGYVKFKLQVQAGTIPVEVAISEACTTVTMVQMTPKFMRSYEPEEVLPIFGLGIRDLVSDKPIQTVSTGTPILMIPLNSHEALRKVKYVDADAYQKLKAGGDFLFPHHFCLKGVSSSGSTFARSLATPPNTLEDPFTGSATGCMAAYLWHHGLMNKPKFVAQQGHWMGRPGEAEIELVGSSQDIQAIRVTGGAVTIARGTLEVQAE
jgi:trans-2,3-dihydro-3-hydroxyanthranilate isomerase